MCMFWLKVSDKKLIHYNNSILNTVQFVGYRYYVLGFECTTNLRWLVIIILTADNTSGLLNIKVSVPNTRLKNQCRIRGKTLIG
jgi:hypothetical protein